MKQKSMHPKKWWSKFSPNVSSKNMSDLALDTMSKTIYPSCLYLLHQSYLTDVPMVSEASDSLMTLECETLGAWLRFVGVSAAAKEILNDFVKHCKVSFNHNAAFMACIRDVNLKTSTIIIVKLYTLLQASVP